MTDDNQPTWPTRPGGPKLPGSGGPAWPSMPGTMTGPTQPASDPLQPLQKKSLAPQGMPGLGAAKQTAQEAEQAPEHEQTPVPVPPADGQGPTPPEAQQAADGQPAPAPVADEPVHMVTCPHCQAEVASYESFCESCGGALTPTSQPPAGEAAGDETPIEGTRATLAATKQTDVEMPAPQQARQCRQCGGLVGPDGYCTNCGAKALSERDHFDERPASWVGGVSDKGVRHYRNEDALALAADPQPGSRAVLVVCDGVSSSQDSDVAALAGARRARDVLVELRPTGIAGVEASRDGAIATAFAEAARQANDAVIAHTAKDSTNAASCTFVSAVIEQGTVYFASLGDSRAYWISDQGPSAILTVDDSVAQARIAMGISREEAENGPQAHAITRWLGRDSEDISPATGRMVPPGPGWVLVCSDGLWNYCSEPDDMARLFAERMAGEPKAHDDVVALADTLVQWAIDQGGKDNISVALARLGELPAPAPQPPPGEAKEPSSQPTAPSPRELDGSTPTLATDEPLGEAQPGTPAPVPASDPVATPVPAPAAPHAADDGAHAANTPAAETSGLAADNQAPTAGPSERM